jgi:glucose/arabinose dehydrogenase
MGRVSTIRLLLGVIAVVVLAFGCQACGSGGKSSGSTSSTAPATATATASSLPKSTDGAPVRVLGHGIPTPTAIAVGNGTVFVGAAGSEEGAKRAGGVFAVSKGAARRVAQAPAVVYGLAFKDGALYVAAGPELLRWSDWNGSSFARRQVLYRGPRGFDGFNGLAFGPDGRLYAGVTLNDKDDHLRSSAPYGQSVVSLKSDGSDLRVLARGLREPFQLTFVAGEPSPYVSVLGQDDLGKTEPPDYIVQARAGQDYGFPACNWSEPSACRRFAKPLILLPAHASPMGIGAIGHTLYVALFGGTGHGTEVAVVPAAGGSVKSLLTGFPASVVALGVNAGTVYVGDLSGTIYSVSVGSGSAVNTDS